MARGASVAEQPVDERAAGVEHQAAVAGPGGQAGGVQDGEVLADGAGGDAEAAGQFGGGGRLVEQRQQAGLGGAEQLFLAPRGDAAALTGALRKLLAADRVASGSAARAHAIEHFDLAAVADGWQALLRTVAAAGPGGR